MKINDKINEIKKNKKIGFMGHIIAGFPDFDSSFQAAMGICEAGADFLEIQFPFSDPFADGPTIEDACYKSLNSGFTVEKGFELVKKITPLTNTFLIIMTYGNIIFKYGIEDFVKKAKQSGVKGLIIPDIPIESDEKLNEICKLNDIENIILATPGANAERIQKLSGIGSGMLYTVIRRGITGKKTDIDNEVEDWLTLVNENSKLPIAAGFGIQTNEQIKELIGKTDIAIVGSYFVKKIKESFEKKLNIKNELFRITKELIE